MSLGNLFIFCSVALVFSVRSMIEGSPAPTDFDALALNTTSRELYNYCTGFHNDYTRPCLNGLDCVCRTYRLCQKTHGLARCRCDHEAITAALKTSESFRFTYSAGIAARPCVAPIRRPVIRTCRRCVRLFGRDRCVNVPCGIEWKCSLLLIPQVLKGTAKNYNC